MGMIAVGTGDIGTGHLIPGDDMKGARYGNLIGIGDDSPIGGGTGIGTETGNGTGPGMTGHATTGPGTTQKGEAQV